MRVIHSIGHDVRVFGSKKQKRREISSAKDRKSLFFLFIFEEKGRKRRKKRKKEEEKKKEKKNARKTSFSFHRAFATRADIYFLNVDSRASGRRARVFRPPFRCARSRKGKTLRRDPFSIQRWRLKKKEFTPAFCDWRGRRELTTESQVSVNLVKPNSNARAIGKTRIFFDRPIARVPYRGIHR